MAIERWSLSVAIWENEKDGKTFYSASISRGYKDAQGQWKNIEGYKDAQGQWKNNEGLWTNDLLAAAELLREAWTMIGKLEQSNRAAEKSRLPKPKPANETEPT